MNKILTKVRKHSLHVVKHIRKYKRNYLLGTFGVFAVVKAALLFAGVFGVMQVSDTFAQVNGELNSGNVTTYCTTGVTACGFTGVTSIAPDTFINHTNLQYLYLQNNQITSLESGDFNGLPNVIALYLYNNQIASIENGAFNGLDSLTDLQIEWNKITFFENGTFDGLPVLNYLDFSSNFITSLESGDFNGISSVTYLDIQNNQISSIEPGTFNGLSGVTNFFLQNNQIIYLASGAFNGLSSVTSLQLNNNQITSLEPGTFNGLSSVTSLQLNNNQITSLEPGTFDGLSGVTSLYLSGNQIASIKNGYFSGFSSLTQLRLNSNKITYIGYSDFNGIPNVSNLQIQGNQITSVAAGTFLSGNGFSKLTMLNSLNPNCSTSAAGIPYRVSSTAITNNLNCVRFTGTDITGFIATLTGRAYELTGDYYSGNKALSFNYSGVNNTLLTNVLMNYVKPGWLTGIYYNSAARVKYDSGTAITYSGQPFTGVVHSPVLFATGSVPGLTDIITLMRFGALINRIDFDIPVTIRMPALGKTSGDIIKIYSSDAESIYDQSGPNRNYEKIGTVITDSSGNAYMEFTGMHASRWALVPLIPICGNTIIEGSEACDGTNLDGKTCADFGYSQGTLLCSASCTFDTAGCSNPSGGGGGGGGGITIIKDICENGDYSPSYYDGLCGTPTTTTTTTHQAAPAADHYITRRELAVFLSIFAKEVLHLTLNMNMPCEFSDISDLTTNEQTYIVDACRYNFMGLHKDGMDIKIDFEGNTLVDKYEYATALSRMLYDGEYNLPLDSPTLRYAKHLAQIQKIGLLPAGMNVAQSFVIDSLITIKNNLSLVQRSAADSGHAAAATETIVTTAPATSISISIRALFEELKRFIQAFTGWTIIINGKTIPTK